MNGPSSPPAAPLYPVNLVVAGRPCLVVGAGPVAARKVEALLCCAADVTVVAPQVGDALGALVAATGPDSALPERGGLPGRGAGAARGTLRVEARPYRSGEAAGYRLAVAATGMAAVDHAVRADAEAAGVWVNVADDPAACTVQLPAVRRAGPVTIAVSTAGTSPAMAGWLVRRLRAAAGDSVGELAELVGEARAALRRAGAPAGALDWGAVLDGPLPGLVAAGRHTEARALLGALLAPLGAALGSADPS